MDETKIEECETPENEFPNKKDDCKKESKGKCKELEAIIEKLTKDLEQEKKTATSYLSTASYYKTQVDETKKDFERFKERNKNIEAEAKTKAAENVAKQILPILDNFDQAMAHVDESVMKGFEMIYKSGVAVLRRKKAEK